MKTIRPFGLDPDVRYTYPVDPRAGQAVALVPNGDPNMPGTQPKNGEYGPGKLGPVCGITHPDYAVNAANYEKWRIVYDGGDNFVNHYCRMLSNRESSEDYRKRKENTPVPAFAKTAINDIKNSIFQRMTDISRKGGFTTYQKAVLGQLGGVDRRGASMNSFIGTTLIAEMLVMKKVGVFVDMPKLAGPTIADKGNKHPYLYIYKAEDIRSWTTEFDEDGAFFTNLLLQDHNYEKDPLTGLPIKQVMRYRLLQVTPENNVLVTYFDEWGNSKEQEILDVPKIPFVLFELTDSMLKDIANHQIALLNLGSSDVSYAMKSNYPFYTEQRDSRTDNQFIKQAIQRPNFDAQSSTTTGEATPSQNEEISTGPTQGRYYPIGADRPDFIAPPTEPLLASMKKQEALKAEIRELVDLSLSNLKPRMASAESKGMDQQGLEAGLSYIGLELQQGEVQIAYHWHIWEGKVNQLPTIQYPKRYKLKTETDERNEAKQLGELKDLVPSQTYQRSMNKKIALTLVGCELSEEDVQKMNTEIDKAPGTTGDSKIIGEDVQNAILDLKNAAILRGYPDDAPQKAADDHAERLARITQAQSEQADAKAAADAALANAQGDPASRGNADGSADPKAAAKEKAASRDSTTKDTTAPSVRGRGK